VYMGTAHVRPDYLIAEDVGTPMTVSLGRCG
jgi:hypothetical protein